MVKLRFTQSISRMLVLALSLSVLFVASCKKDPNPGVSNREINQWILDTMSYYYYWNKTIPGRLNFDLGPEDFFESLLNRPTDRFSWIQNAQELKDELRGVIKTSGLGFGLFDIDGSRAGVTVRYVLKGSPAEAAGIKRGDIFTRVNGAALTIRGGYVQGYEAILGNETFTLTSATISGDVISEGDTRSLTPVQGFQEDAIHMEDVIVTDNGTRVGYLFYNRFLEQQQELVEAFARFKAAGVTELIVDERYNGGGSLGVAALMAAMIHNGFNINSEFIRFEFNSNFRNESLTYGDLFGAVNASLVNTNNLGLNRVFILATRSSASASELLINNLEPFLDVVHIGSTTYGKDEASFTFENSSPKFEGKNDWGIQPIIIKYKNRNGVGNFVNGLVPDYQVSETLPYAPMGAKSDPLIFTALGIIDPGMQVAMQRQMDAQRRRQPTGMKVLEEESRDLANPRPLDVTKALKGGGLKLN